jgi:hypothetical protein
MTFNKIDYGILALVSALYVAFIFRYQTNSRFILLGTGVFATIYIVWGVFHHVRAGSLHARIMLEYLLVAILGVAIISTLLV